MIFDIDVDLCDCRSENFASNGYTLTTDAMGRLLIVLELWTDKNGKGQWRAGRDGRKELGRNLV